MRKAVCIFAALLCIFLSSCTDDNSIGIIGGADGPTAILVGKEISD